MSSSLTKSVLLVLFWLVAVDRLNTGSAFVLIGSWTKHVRLVIAHNHFFAVLATLTLSWSMNLFAPV